MTDVARIPVELGGWFGAPGVNVIYATAPAHGSFNASNLAGILQSIYDSYNDSLSYIAPGVTIDVPDICQVYDDNDGSLLYVQDSGETFPVLTGSGNGSESRASQALLQLHTQDIINNRIVQGRIFLGPLASGAVGTDGLITPTAVDDLLEAWSGTIDPLSSRITVWHRPKNGTGGQYCDAQTMTVRARPATLRGRNK